MITPSADSKAIVAYNSPDGKSLNWKLETVQVRTSLKPHEVLVELKSVGICHTDMAFGMQTPIPKIMGHEGSGYVKAVGEAVSVAKIGDPVVLSYSCCGDCKFCKTDRNSYCTSMSTQNLFGTDDDTTFMTEAGERAEGKFFGQSSFSNITVVNESCVVNVKEFDLTEQQMIELAPFGCGIQTGVGAVINAAKAEKGQSVVVYGMGGVGFAVMMAAKMAGCSPIIAVDLVDSKLELAKTLGATHTINGANDQEVHDKIFELTAGGADLSFECIGGGKFIEAAVNNCGNLGKVIYLGVSALTDVVNIPVLPFLLGGKTLISCLEGNAVPQEFVPKMIKWYLEGELPVDKIEKVYPFEDYMVALGEIQQGKTIKAILKY
ncbi:hypothetical protein DASC09_045540 [Saccharomycopsis crataegensis]|uniref:Enoyl reductase (ER) domain-containing protein n=1 Tax=Saccharomycopsis crataegensis TaxID=43959 RepID=A0AAV5QRZ5_9ASCO|nr:hypothetical protein DASC09_045540 [Saccharomycopsis crataegensis]